MPWLKVSDTAAFHPVVTGPLTEALDPDDRLDQADLVNLAFGLVLRCATHSAGFLTDYLVPEGVVALMGGPNWRKRAEVAERAGYWRRVDGGWLILDDPENFVHIRLKAELDWERQRRKDTSNSALIVPVRLRDGDGCRYCPVIVNWRDRKGGRGGTYDHRIPGHPATGPDDLRVACNSCNGFRSNHPDADSKRPPQPAPSEPFYGPDSVALLAKHGYHVPLSTSERPGRQPGHAPAATPPPAEHRAPATREILPDTAPPSTATRQPVGSRTPRPQPAPPADTTHRDLTASQATHKPTKQDHTRRQSADPADRRHAGSGSPGRDGTGREPTSLTPVDRNKRRRGRRGRSPHPAPRSPEPRGGHHH